MDTNEFLENVKAKLVVIGDPITTCDENTFTPYREYRLRISIEALQDLRSLMGKEEAEECVVAAIREQLLK